MERAKPKERTPEEIFIPANVDLTILFTAHSKASDLGEPGEFRKKLKNFDILVPECFGANEDDLTRYRKISRGYIKPTPYRSHFPYYIQNFENELHGSHISIALADVDIDNPLTNILSSNRVDAKNFFNGDLNNALDEIARKNIEFMIMQEKREKIILAKIGPAISNLINSNPKLRKKERVKVLMLIGALHQPIFPELVKVAEQQRLKTGSDHPSVNKEGITDFSEIGKIDYQTLLNLHFSSLPFSLSQDSLRENLIRALGAVLLSTIQHRQLDNYGALQNAISLIDSKDIVILYEDYCNFRKNPFDETRIEKLRSNPVLKKIEEILD